MRKYLLSILLFFTTSSLFCGYAVTWKIVLDTTVGQSQFYMVGQLNIGETTSTIKITISSNAVISLLSGEYIKIASNTYIVGYASATEFFGSGAGIYGVTGVVDDACRLSTGAIQVELDLIEIDTGTLRTDLTSVEVSTGILAFHISADTNTLQGLINAVESDTGTLKTTLDSVQADTGTLRTDVWNTFLATYTAGAQVEVSTNLYVVGYTSAGYFIGDGSGLFNVAGTGGVDADCRISTGILRNEYIASTTTLAYQDYLIAVDTANITTGGIDTDCRISTGTLLSKTSAQTNYGRLTSSNTWIGPQHIDAGGGQALTIENGGDFYIYDGARVSFANIRVDNVGVDAYLTMTGVNKFDISNANFKTNYGIEAATSVFSGDVTINGDIKKTTGERIKIDTHTYTNGYSSATKFYGDGSGLFNITGAGEDTDCRISTGILKNSILDGLFRHTTFFVDGYSNLSGSLTVINTNTTDSYVAYFGTDTAGGFRVSTNSYYDAPNQPSFHAYNSANQSVPDATDTQLVFNSVKFNDGGMYDVASGSAIIKVAGEYHIYSNGLLVPLAIGKYATIEFYKNGTKFAYKITGGAGSNTSIRGETWEKLVVGDTIAVYTYQDTGSALIYSGHASAGYNQFYMRKVK